MENEDPIEVVDVSKAFRVYKDKSHTFKDKVLAHKRSHYTFNRVLDHVSFSVRRGEALGLIGHNGCGKSTTLKLLNQILYPDSGEIRMKGRISSLIELGAGFHPDMTGRENIYINATIFGLHKKEIDQRLDDIIRFSELEQFIDNPVRTYSSGMYMRLAFAIAINVDADILLVDEILAVGDVNFQRKCFEKLSEIKKNGATIVIVSHSMDQIKSICDSVIWLDGGHIKKEGKAADVCEEYLLEMHQVADERMELEARERGLKNPEDPMYKYPPFSVGDQISRYARRSGTMQLRFSRIALCDGEGNHAREFQFGQPLRIEYSIAGATENMEMPNGMNVLFYFFHEDGSLCSSFNSACSLGRSVSYKELQKGVLTIDKLGLADGNYLLDAVIADIPGKACDWLAHLIEFHVSTPRSYGEGSAAAVTRWDFE